MFAKRCRERLILQREAGLYRNPLEITARRGQYVLAADRELLSFASNDYLGLASCAEWSSSVAKNFLMHSPSSSSSRLVGGNYAEIRRAEREYAAFFGYEDALFFPSGYQANLAVISTFFEKGDTLLVDKRIHNSSVKGVLLSGASFQGYNHNAMKHLAGKLERCRPTTAAVLTESLFSMDGDLLDVEAFGRLRSRYGFFSLVDEAHAFGALGEMGRGLAQGVADVAVGTFGKALGLFGAFVLLPAECRDFMMNFCSALIYSTSLSEAHAASARDLLAIVADSDERRTRLREVSLFMKQRLSREDFRVSGNAHILAVQIGEEGKAARVAAELQEEGIFVLPARYPTVPLGRAMLRISMTALHTQENVDHFARALVKVNDLIRAEKSRYDAEDL